MRRERDGERVKRMDWWENERLLLVDFGCVNKYLSVPRF